LVTGATVFGGGADRKGVEENEKLILLSPVVMLMVRQESARIGSQVKSSHGEVSLRNWSSQTPGRGVFPRYSLDACADSLQMDTSSIYCCACRWKCWKVGKQCMH